MTKSSTVEELFPSNNFWPLHNNILWYYWPVETKIAALILLGFLLSGCQPHESTVSTVNTAQANKNTQTIPETFESPLDLPGPQIPQPAEPAVDPSAKKGQPEIVQDKAPVRRLQTASRFIQSAEFIMLTEGKKIGTPCNLFLQRVLQYSGYPQGNYLANDFDIYAKKKLRPGSSVNFVNDGKGSEHERLKRHLWSFPERTPFIMQWSRTGYMGHLAIVERVNEKLIIYQASLNKYTARKDQTTVTNLLTGYNRRTLTVYADF